MLKSTDRKLRSKRLVAQDGSGITSVLVTFEEKYTGQYTPYEFRERFNTRLSNAHDALRKQYDVTEIRIAKP